jgi:hypothetical protein
MPNIQGVMFCDFCGHASHAKGQKCGVVQDNGKPCKCKATAGFWSGFLSGLGNAIGESLFGGNR